VSSYEKTEPSTVAFTWRTLSQIKDITKLKILQSTSVANFLIIISNDVDSDKELYKNLLLKDWFKDETAYEEFFADITQANLPGARKYSVSNFGRIASYLLVLSTRGCLSEEGLKTCLHSGILNGFGLAGVSISNTHLSPEEASGDLNETDKNLVKILYDERIKPTPRATRP
jgi:hypothetical protein